MPCITCDKDGICTSGCQNRQLATPIDISAITNPYISGTCQAQNFTQNCRHYAHYSKVMLDDAINKIQRKCDDWMNQSLSARAHAEVELKALRAVRELK